MALDHVAGGGLTDRLSARREFLFASEKRGEITADLLAVSVGE